MPLLSVCMTTYNHERYIAQAIESVLCQQTTFAVEVVIGEDCSTDGTLQICSEYENCYPDRVRIIASEHNVGMHENYRRTIEACRGKYIAMLDGDDWFSDTQKLQMQVELLEKCVTPARSAVVRAIAQSTRKVHSIPHLRICCA